MPGLGRIVLSYGPFDRFDAQHALFLQQATGLGDTFIIGCATDAFIMRQGMVSHDSYACRKEMLEHCRYVDRVIALNDVEQIRTDIVNYNASILVMTSEDVGEYDFLQDIAQVVYLPSETPPQKRLKRAS